MTFPCRATPSASCASPRRRPKRCTCSAPAIGSSAGPATPRGPRVFFEEWDEPLISGIRWVEELVAIAGGEPVFPHLKDAGLAKDRIVTPDAVRDAAPDVVLASWCGKKVKKATIESRTGWR